MNGDQRQRRLSAFVGRSFLPEDEPLWAEIRALLDSLAPLGFVYEDAREAQPRGVSEKVRLGITRNDMYIGILSRRQPLADRSTTFWLVSALRRQHREWATSPWVIQESGYALGAGRRVLLLIEDAVHFPVANLDADREWVSFRRDAVKEMGPRLTSIIANLLAETLPPQPATEQLAAPLAPAASDQPSVPSSEQATFIDIRRLIDQGQFRQADEAFEKYAATHEDLNFRTWLSRYYARLKAIRGAPGAVEELRTAVASDPGDVDARISLAAYYRHFHQYSDAISILVEGVPYAAPRLRPKLVREAAATHTAAGADDEALRLLASLLLEVEDPGERRDTFVALANVAKKMKLEDVEASALEAALALDPADGDLRFRLAYLYSQMDRDYLAMYHYKMKSSQGRDSVTLNNLGVAYGRLQLPAKEVAMWEEAGAQNPLALANLSHAYIDRGFLAKAEELANRVLTSAEQHEDNDRRRAAAALELIAQKRANEQDKEDSAATTAQTEAAFRARYARSWLGTPVVLDPGAYATPHGQFTIQAEGSRLLGTASFREETPPPLFASLLGPTGSDARVRTRTVQFEAAIRGGAGTVKITTTITDEGSLLAFPETTTVEGLILLGEDGRSFEVLEKMKGSSKIYRGVRV